MNKLLELFFARRGVSWDELRRLTSVGTVDLPDLDRLCERLHEIHESPERPRVALFTDFDMDGIMTGVVGYAGLDELGFLTTLGMSQPTRGYGIHKEDIDDILSERPDTKVLLTGDVGIGDEEGIAYAVSRGLEVFVTDHHDGTPPPSASIVVDPMLGPEGSFKGICGAHVMYMVLRRYAELYADREMVMKIDRLRVFAGIATVADSMPVFHENRGIIMDAVSLMRMIWADGDQAVVNLLPGGDVYRRAMLGVFILCEKFKEAKKLADMDSIDETFFGFYLVPVFNSVKRMDMETKMAYEVFFGGWDRSVAAMDALLKLNDKRKESVEKAEKQMLKVDKQPLAPYVYQTMAPAGIRGLLAQKAMTVTGMPCVVVGPKDDGTGWYGSGRSPEWFQFLDEESGLPGVHPAGHQGAFGITLDSWEAAESLYRDLAGKVGAAQAAGKVTEARPELWVSGVDENADAELDVDLFFEFLRELNGYRPFGPGFRDPSVRIQFRTADAKWMRFGTEGKHVKAVLPMGLSVMWFNQAADFETDTYGRLDMSKMPEVTDARGTMNLNRFMGHESVQVMVR